jgi:hypothetical protein
MSYYEILGGKEFFEKIAEEFEFDNTPSDEDCEDDDASNDLVEYLTDEDNSIIETIEGGGIKTQQQEKNNDNDNFNKVRETILNLIKKN